MTVRKFVRIREKCAQEGRERARIVAAPTEAYTSAEAYATTDRARGKRQYHSSGLVFVVVFSCEGKVIMDVHAVLKVLHQERELLNQAIVTLEILARGKGKRRGRPPRWLREGRQPSPPKHPGRKLLHRE